MAVPEAEIIQRGMEFASNNGELIVTLGVLALGALTFLQRKAIRERDKTCQVPVPHDCDISVRQGEVDHIVPQGWGKRRLGMSEEQLDVPENLVYECHEFHQNVRHPDMKEARRRYAQGEKDGFNKVFKRRERLTERGEKYWYSAYDDELKDVAKRQTEAAKKQGWRFPGRK